MKKFLTENSGPIIKFLSNHIVMSILGIMVGLAILSAEGNVDGMSSLALVGGLFCVGFLCFLQYDGMFFFGSKDGIKARADGKKPRYFKGALVSLVAYSPVILTVIALIIAQLIERGGQENASGVLLFLFYAIQGSYISFYSLIGKLGPSLFAVITLIPSFVSATLGYIMGALDMPIRKLLGFNIKPPYDGPVERRRDYREQGGSDKE